MLKELREKVYEANMQLPHLGLVIFTWGNASEFDPETGLSNSTVVTRRLAALSIPTPLMPPHGRRRGVTFPPTARRTPTTSMDPSLA